MGEGIHCDISEYAYLVHWLGFVTFWCRGSFPSQARELVREAAEC
jgi:hypothetical protein